MIKTQTCCAPQTTEAPHDRFDQFTGTIKWLGGPGSLTLVDCFATVEVPEFSRLCLIVVGGFVEVHAADDAVAMALVTAGGNVEGTGDVRARAIYGE